MFGCNVYSDGSAAAIDTWNPSSAKTNILDNTQVGTLNYYIIRAKVDIALSLQDGFCQHSVIIDDGTLSCK